MMNFLECLIRPDCMFHGLSMLISMFLCFVFWNLGLATGPAAPTKLHDFCLWVATLFGFVCVYFLGALLSSFVIWLFF